MLPTSASMCVRDTGTAKGRGVFALRRFEADETVELAPIILLRMPFVALPPELQTVVFSWGYLSGGGDMNLHALALGNGSLYNHDNPANLRYQADPAQNALRFMAVRPISEGEELTINYNAHGGGPTWNDNKWFERMNVRLIENRG